MEIFIGADHRGFEQKEKVKSFLIKLGHNVHDIGTKSSDELCDYPPIARDVAMRVAQGDTNTRGILLCMTGIGHSIAANKVPGAYAALVYNETAAALSREHNNSNILVLGARFVESESAMYKIIEVWLKTPFEGGRHARRINQIKDMEKEFFK